MSYFILTEPPVDFKPTIIAAGCACIYENKILLLKRHPNKPYPNTWGVPGGKMEGNEEVRDCVVREIQEEAGLNIDEDDLKRIGALYCSIPNEGPNGNAPLKYVFHLFQKTFKFAPILNLGLEEHTDAKWVSLDEAFKLPLIVGGKEALELYVEMN